MKEINMNVNNSMNLTVLVIGFDGYKDVWDIFFELYCKNWPDHPRTILSTNGLCPNYPNIEVIANSKTDEWSNKVRIALENVDTDYVCLLLEDFFIGKTVETNKIKNLVSTMVSDNIDYVKLLNQSPIKGNDFKNNINLKIIPKGEKYGISLQPSIWNKEFLLNLLGDKNYNAWIFEFNRVKNPVQNLDRINCLAENTNLLNIIHGIVQQEYLPDAVKQLKKIGIEIPNGPRKIMSTTKYLKYRLKQVFSRVKSSILKGFFKRIGRLMGVDFVSDRELNK